MDSQQTHTVAGSDPLDDVFTLEDQLYTQGYSQGVEDGAQAGRTQGRSFGMEKGFEKFLQSGRLAGRSMVWLSRLPANQSDTTGGGCTLPPLPGNARLDKNVRALYALVEPETLSTENTDEAVQDFDDRLKRAQGKAKIVERMMHQGQTT